MVKESDTHVKDLFLYIIVLMLEITAISAAIYAEISWWRTAIIINLSIFLVFQIVIIIGTLLLGLKAIDKEEKEDDNHH